VVRAYSRPIIHSLQYEALVVREPSITLTVVFERRAHPETTQRAALARSGIGSRPAACGRATWPRTVADPGNSSFLTRARLSLAGPKVVICSEYAYGAFLSHSSADKEIVIAVHDGLEPSANWLDRAEIEWGALFLEKIADGIASSTDFVLFWSSATAESEWVRIELNMAFIQALRRKAIRIRVVRLDGTPLPLYLEPFQAFSVAGSASPAADILQKLVPLLREPVRSARSAFVNRHDDIGRLEMAVDNPEVHAVWAFGFTGIGKTSLVKEALHRIFHGADIAQIDVNQGTGFVELALELSALSRNETLPVGLDREALVSDIGLSIETLAHDGRLLFLSNVQYWLEEGGEPGGPLPLVLSIARALMAFEKRPVFSTSTRRPSLGGSDLQGLALIHVPGLKDDHIATIVRNWHYSIYGRELSADDSKRIAPKLYGHPVAARLVAGLLGNHTVSFWRNTRKRSSRCAAIWLESLPHGI